MNVLLWHVHGAWTTAFVQGRHRYLVPVVPGRGPDGRGRARTYPWPDRVEEVPPERLAERDIDVVVLQRPHEEELVGRWTRRRVGRDLPAVYVEHNTPQQDVPRTRHPMADRDDLRVVHVTHFNALFWDTGATRTAVVPHGIPVPSARYTGELSRLGVVANEPVRRGRATGTDLMPGFAALAPVDVYGLGVTTLPAHLGLAPERMSVHEDLAQPVMHRHLGRRRLYLHLCRWTSLGLSLLEAMAMGMPVVALATTEVASAVPPGAGVVSTRVETLREAVRWLLADPPAAARLGAGARRYVQTDYGLARFLADWDRLLEEERCASR